MSYLARLTVLANTLDRQQRYREADLLDKLVRFAYDKDDERVVNFINEYGDTSRGEQMEDIMWVALEKGMPDVYRAIDKKLNFDMLWRAIKEMTAAREEEQKQEQRKKELFDDFMRPL